MRLSDSMRLPSTIHRLLLVFVILCHGTEVDAADDYAAGVAAVEAGDYGRAYAAWLPLAEAGDPASQFNIGMLYARGEGVARDYTEAARWFREAAEQGQVEAQAHLGGMYARGIGVEQDYREAALWLNRSAEQHHKQSQYELGVLYANGTGVGRDYGAAYFWFTLAGLQGYIPALAAKDEVRPYMSVAQTMMIEQQAQEWLQANVPPPAEDSSKP